MALLATGIATLTAIGATSHTYLSCHSITMWELKLLIPSPQLTLQFCFQFRMVPWPITAGPISSLFASNSIWTSPRLSPSGHLGTQSFEPSTILSSLKLFCDLNNSNNQAYCLTTYLSPGNLCAIAAADFEHDILAHTLQDGPVDLLSPTFNLTVARLDRTTLVSEIRSKIIMLAMPLVLDCLFNLTEQVYQAVTVSSGDSASVASTLTGITGTSTSSYATGSGQGRGRGRHVTYMYVISVLTTCVSPTCPIIPVGIQSLMPHIPLLLGQSLDDH